MITFKNKAYVFLTFAVCCLTFGCTTTGAPNELTAAEKAEGWELLFDGKTLNKWHLYNNPAFKGAWYVEQGAINANPEEAGKRADLVTDKSYENYELKLEWKLAKEGNSGVFINVQEHDSLATPWMTGPEYQLLEDSHPDIDKPLKRAGCLYGFTPQKNFVNTKKYGDWNTTTIIQKNGVTQFFLNDVLTAEMDFNTAQWKTAIRNSSFKDKPEFGIRTQGKIALQDWANGVSFRNIKIKEL